MVEQEPMHKPAIADSVLDLIGRTPLVRLHRVLPAGAAEVLGKFEVFNPGGSVKDRIALSMIEAAEAAGAIQPGATLVEPTSGNTGIGLAMVAARKGYRLVLTMPEDMSVERRRLLERLGADLLLTPAIEGMTGAVYAAQELVERHGGTVIHPGDAAGLAAALTAIATGGALPGAPDPDDPGIRLFERGSQALALGRALRSLADGANR